MAQTTAPPRDPVPKRQARGIEPATFACAAGLAASPSSNLSHQLPLPAQDCPSTLLQPACASSAKKNNLLTVSGLFFLRGPGWIGTVSRGPNGRKTELPAVHCKGLLSRRLPALLWACPAVPQRPTSLIARTFGTLSRPLQLRALCCTRQGNKPALLAASGSDFCFRSARNTQNTAQKNGPRAVSDGFGADSVANSTATGSRSKPVSPTPPAPAGLPEHPVAAWLRQQRKKKQLTDGQWVVLFCAARLGLEQFLAGRTGGKLSCPLSL